MGILRALFPTHVRGATNANAPGGVVNRPAPVNASLPKFLVHVIPSYHRAIRLVSLRVWYLCQTTQTIPKRSYGCTFS